MTEVSGTNREISRIAVIPPPGIAWPIRQTCGRAAHAALIATGQLSASAQMTAWPSSAIRTPRRVAVASATSTRTAPLTTRAQIGVAGVRRVQSRSPWASGRRRCCGPYCVMISPVQSSLAAARRRSTRSGYARKAHRCASVSGRRSRDPGSGAAASFNRDAARPDHPLASGRVCCTEGTHRRGEHLLGATARSRPSNTDRRVEMRKHFLVRASGGQNR